MRLAKDYPFETVEIECAVCGRYGRYSRDRFVEIVGPDTALPQALTTIAKSCPNKRPSTADLRGQCRPIYRNIAG